MYVGNFFKNGSFLGHFVHPRGKISNLVFKWIFGCSVAKICYIKQNNSQNTQKRPNKNFCKNLHWIVCANLINLQKNDKQTVFQVYLTLTMPLNLVFRFLFKYGGWYLNCTYNYVCTPTKYENMKISEQIWVDTIVALHSWHMPILCLQHTYTTCHQFVCYFLVIPIMFNYYKLLNQSYIYKLVWKIQVNCQRYTLDVLRVFTLNFSTKDTMWLWMSVGHL